MRAELADWVNRRLIEQRGDRLSAPGGSQTFRALEANGAELTVIARGDSFDVYQGKRAIYNFALSPAVALRLAWWLLWTWWVCGMWAGLKWRLWQWSLRARKV